ncbi:unnamed protein product [Rhizoctonia solani]|uniref:glutathione transferase n=1 Tax=Rhizoctonia solani TaxID=456999 RepID=A0A8H3AAY8_9AGAM|nr:unnamed protein product [Rhizoctonia solani]
MVTVKLHGMPYSTCTHRVWTTAQEIGINVELIPVDLAKAEHKTQEYIENYHPFGVVPVLEDEDGTKIFESRAICRYLVAKYAKGSPLLPDPSDPKAYGLFEQAASIEYSTFDPPASTLTYERIVAPMREEKPNEELIKKSVETLTAKMDGYERILSKQKYLAGDTFTLADLFHLPYGQITSAIEPQILASKPHVKAWWDDISSRESWKATLKFSGH